MAGEVSNHGVILSKGSGTPVVYSPIANVVSIDPPSIQNEEVEVTNQDSNGKEFIAGGLIEVTEFSITVNYVDDTLAEDAMSGVVSNYKIDFPNNKSWSFKAFVKEFKPNSSDSSSPEALQAEVTFRPSGIPTLA